MAELSYNELPPHLRNPEEALPSRLPCSVSTSLDSGCRPLAFFVALKPLSPGLWVPAWGDTGLSPVVAGPGRLGAALWGHGTGFSLHRSVQCAAAGLGARLRGAAGPPQRWMPPPCEVHRTHLHPDVHTGTHRGCHMDAFHPRRTEWVPCSVWGSPTGAGLSLGVGIRKGVVPVPQGHTHLGGEGCVRRLTSGSAVYQNDLR